VKFKHNSANAKLVSKTNIDKYIWRVEDAITKIGKRHSNSPLTWDDGLALSASDNCFEKDKDSPTILQRIKLYGQKTSSNYAQVLSFGQQLAYEGGIEREAFLIVMRLLDSHNFK